ncbi:signal peptidase I, partial [Francisella tularensis subsp. holarctica]|nr:signal peptidase I [Francisella tularensis subsp. holarctica]
MLSFTFWVLFLTIASGLIYIIDFVFLQKSRLAAYTDELKGLSKKQKRQLYKDRGLKAPFIADQASTLVSVFFVVFVLRTWWI